VQGPLKVTWPIDNVNKIGGYTAKYAGAPTVTDGGGSKEMCFNGKDALVIPVNPLAEQGGFSVEVFFKPARGGGGTQTVIHMEDAMGDGRLFLEVHASPDGSWQPRATVRNKIDQVKLEPKINLPKDTWYWMSITFGDGLLRLFVNGKQEAESKMSLIPMNQGNMAIGTRLHFANWLKGCVKEIRLANGALPLGQVARPAGAIPPG
jgi:hypothetical protein